MQEKPPVDFYEKDRQTEKRKATMVAVFIVFGTILFISFILGGAWFLNEKYCTRGSNGNCCSVSSPCIQQSR